MNYDNKHELIIHIGTPKTGTSALQKFLYENNSILKPHGWCYPDLVTDMESNGVKIFVHESEKCKNGVVGSKFVLGSNKFSVNTNIAEWDMFCKFLLDYLKDYNVILSEESIWWWDTQSFLREIKKVFPRVKIIVYLRRQDRFIESDWNQRIKHYGFCTMTFEENVLCRKGDIIFNYLEKLKQIEEICGRENIIVRVYEKEQYMGERHDIISDFLYALGIPGEWEKYKFIKSQNESLESNYLEIKRQLNRLLKGKTREYKREVENAFLEYIQINKTISGRGVEGYFNEVDRKKVIEYFAHDNEQIAKRYLKRENGELFYDMDTNIPQAKLNYETICQDTFDVLDSIFNTFYKVERKTTLLGLKGNRKLAYFGAGINCCNLLHKYDLPVNVIIDNAEEKCGIELAGRRVICADKIQNWKDYFIIVTVQFPELIEEQLVSYGLVKGTDFILAVEFGIL